jgi:thioredoxin-dependent peroxiredoxin
MKRLLTYALLASALTLPAFAALKSGDKATDFKAHATLAGKEFDFSLAEALKKGPAVVYFYPAAFTRGCNAEAHAFAESADKFAAAGATIIGVSRDTIEKLNMFSSDPEYCAGKFPVAADTDGSISRSYDLKNSPAREGAKDVKGNPVNTETTERTTFVITPDHKIVATFSSNDDKISPADHAEKSLALVEQLKTMKK